MPRLIDYALNSRLPESVKLLLQSSQHIVCDNVAKYFYERKNMWSVNDFPNVAPPFEAFFIEHSLKWTTLGNDAMVGNLVVAIPCSCEPFDSVLDMILPPESEFEEFREIIQKRKNDAEWILNVDHCMTTKGHDVFIAGGTIILVSNDGSILRNEEGASMFFSVSSGSIGEPSSFFSSLLFPSLLAISFLHCKNVTMEQVVPPAPFSKRHQKKHGRPLEKYHVLNIEPMKKVLRTEGQSEKTGLRQALHICRGHFKDFSKGAGLFGKYKGLYWWDSQVRGSHTEGVIDKDYNVKPPKKS